jgi:transcriptional regulator with XRE-family HTH domain
MTHHMVPAAPVGTALRDARLAAGLTRDELAVCAGVGSATVTRIENGHVRPNRSTLRAIAAALHERSDCQPTTNEGRPAKAAPERSSRVTSRDPRRSRR